MTQFYKEYTKVFVAVDCIIFGFDGKNLQVLIGKRKMDPGRDEWSLYGGFVGQHESLEEAANRVILDLTGRVFKIYQFFDTFFASKYKLIHTKSTC